MRQRRILQFNNFVFRGLVSANFTRETRISLNQYMLVAGANASIGSHQNQEISITYEEELDNRFYSKVDRKAYERWSRMQLFGKGILFAIDSDGTYIQTEAIVKTVSEAYNYDSTSRQIQVTFVIPSGYWQRCDDKNTFVVPYCDKDYYKCNQCFTDPDYCETEVSNDCADCRCPSGCSGCDICRACDYIPVCSEPDIDWCQDGHRVEINCNKGYAIFKEKSYGEEITLDTEKRCSVSMFCSQTEFTSNSGIITLTGSWFNPELTINGREFALAGVYDGTTTIDIDNNKIINIADNGKYEDVTNNLIIYSLPYFKAENGKSNYIKVCGNINSESRLFLKFTENII